MKSKLLVLTLAPAMLIAAPRLAAADAAGTNDPVGHRQEKLARFDKNGDGTLDDAEKAEAREAIGSRRPGEPGAHPLHAHFMRQYDADGDGKLTDEEKAKAQADWKAFVAKHDSDGDGKLSPSETKAAREAWAKEHPEAAAKLRAHVDKNGDGEISRAEKRAAAKEARKKRKAVGESSGGTK